MKSSKEGREWVTPYYKLSTLIKYLIYKAKSKAPFCCIVGFKITLEFLCRCGLPLARPNPCISVELLLKPSLVLGN